MKNMMDLETTSLRWRWWAASLLPRLAGPIFDKEMRVSSRRRRNYVLRFLYIGLFTFLASVVWLDSLVRSTSSVYQASRMAAAGQTIVTAILWFQFLTAPAIAAVMLSTSISDEIYKRTLGVLMTTPIGSFQIVIGKLMSRLLQIVLLLAISLPLLAVVRVFGGVPWSFLLCGLCVTLTTVIFVGSLSLFFSIFTRQAYAAIIETVLAMGFLFGGIPVLLAFLTDKVVSPPTLMRWLSYFNPFVVMGAAMEALYMARPAVVAWPLHCAVMLGLSALLLLLATILVRRAALRQAGGIVDANRGTNPPSTIRRVQGPPVLWKERRAPLFGRRKLRRVAEIVSGVVILGLLLLTYGLCYRANLLRDTETHVMYGVVFFSVGVLFTVILPATCITTEKESQTWPLLLTTTVSNWEILWSKFAGAARRCLPAWVLLFAHTLVFMGPGTIHPIAVVHLALLVAWVVFFLTSTGLYFSTRLRHTTTAVIANVGLAAGLWAVFPLFLAIFLGVMTKTSTGVIETYMDLNPFVHAGVIVNAAAHRGGLGTYDWLQRGMGSLSDATCWMALTFAVYVSVGLVFLTRAAARLRNNPF
ncbi:MAG: ABC transporter permease [Planctomycetes bacterium]|nr:ABC transporter permease [Planctomycetota bacterium]